LASKPAEPAYLKKLTKLQYKDGPGWSKIPWFRFR